MPVGYRLWRADWRPVEVSWGMLLPPKYALIKQLKRGSNVLARVENDFLKDLSGWS